MDKNQGKKTWPDSLAETDTPEFLDAIKLEYIEKATCERDDLYYESAASGWDMSLKLNINGVKCSARIDSGNPNYKRIEDMLRTSDDFYRDDSEVNQQIGRYAYKKGWKEKLTKEVAKIVRPNEIIYAEYANKDAIGDHGSVRIFVLHDKKIHFYYASLFDKKPEKEGYTAGCDLLSKLSDKGTLEKLYVGFGNTAFRKAKVVFERNDADWKLIYNNKTKSGWWRHEVKASSLEVYNKVAWEFAKWQISDEKLKEWKEYDSPFEHLLPEYLRNLLPEERMLLKNFAEEYDSSWNWKTTLDDYFSAMDYILYINRMDTHCFGANRFADEHGINDGKEAIARYRLKYILEKLGDDWTGELFCRFDFDNAKPGALFKAISARLNEDITKKFLDYQVVKSDAHNLSANCSNVEALFKYPVVIDFSKSAHQKIVTSILKMTPDELKERPAIGYYFANCHYLLEQLPLPVILPAALHVAKNMPKEGPPNSNISTTYYAAEWLIWRAWGNVSEGNDEYDKRFEKIIYETFWPQINGIWPIEHIGEFRLIESESRDNFNEIGEFIFYRAIWYIMALEQIEKFNPKLFEYLKNADQSSYSIIYERMFKIKIADWDETKIISEIQKFLEKASFCHQPAISNADNLMVFFPTTIKRAEFIVTELARGEEGLFAGSTYPEELLAKLLYTPHYKGIGHKILGMVVDNFDKFNKFCGGEDAMNFCYFAACTGVTEKDELEPLEAFKDKILTLETNKNAKNARVIKSAFATAKKQVKVVQFQRKALREWMDKDSK